MSESGTEKKYVELDALFKRADEVVATSVIGRPKRGSGYVPKVDAKIRLNVEVMEWLRAMGPRHYSRINGLLTALMEAEKQSRAQQVSTESGSNGAQAAVSAESTSDTPSSDTETVDTNSTDTQKHPGF